MESFVSVNKITELIELGQDIVERVGDCSNLERKVNIRSILWETICVQNGLTLQKDHLTNKARIVDYKGIQKGNGSLVAMKEKMDRLLSEDFLRPGDVIGVSRGAYEHYAIYLGEGEVIHYAGDNTDFKGRISIHKAPFSDFLKDSKDYFVVSFEGKYPIKIQSSTKFIASGYFDCKNARDNNVYSPAETVKRALSRLGETQYSLIKNNCEHFAMWCKTGVSESTQVKLMAKYVIAVGIRLNSVAESEEDIAGYLAG